MVRNRLEKLYAEHGGKVSDKWSLYFSEYDRVFESMANNPIRLLEIGVQNGGSLEIWAKYFQRALRIIGCDVNSECGKLVYADPRITLVVGNANQDQIESRILGLSSGFDIVIDDGSHLSGDIVKSFARYFRHLSDGGIYIAEDLHCSYWQAYQGGIFDPTSSISFFKRLADVVSHEHWGVSSTRRSLLANFFRSYQVDIPEKMLERVHSVEFVNSMCFVRKESPEANVIGCRFIAGSDAAVFDGVSNLHGMTHPRAHEEKNPWSDTLMLPEDELIKLRSEVIFLSTANDKSEALIRDRKSEHEAALARVAELEDRCRQLSKEVKLRFDIQDVAKRVQEAVEPYRLHQKNIDNSTSWRITAPVRWGGKKLRTLKRIRRVFPLVADQHDGVIGATTWFYKVLKKSGVRGLREVFHSLERSKSAPANSVVPNSVCTYAEWIRQYDTLDAIDCARINARSEKLLYQPLISILMPTYNANRLWLGEAIDSVRGQIYKNWELCIADDASTDSEVKEWLRALALEDSRIKLVFRPENGHISAASNSALELATGDWIALMDHDDLIAGNALSHIVECINLHPDAKLIYSDEDKVNEQGSRSDPYFKSDWNIDLFYSHNMYSHFGAFESELVRKVGGFRQGLEGSQDYDLVLRCIEQVRPDQIKHIPKVLYHWRVHAASTASSANTKPYAQIAGERALNEHFQRMGIKGHVETAGHSYRARYDLPDPAPLVSLIIPTRNAVELVRQCIDSIVGLTTYPNYEIILIDNGSDDKESLEYFHTLAQRPRFKILRDDDDFNYSALNNKAVARSAGEIVGLINNDIEVISPEWLSEMVSIAIQPGVGAVGARLWYPSGTMQHGGVVLGVGGVANHAHKNLPRGVDGYFGRANLIQSFSAVTAACLLIRKAHYESVGGLDEVNLKVAFNDVDFCLRLRDSGLRNVWTPYADLFHHESATRGEDISPEKRQRFVSEVDYMRKRWGDALERDPAYNPNLTLLHEDFGLAWPPRSTEQSC